MDDFFFLSKILTRILQLVSDCPHFGDQEGCRFGKDPKILEFFLLGAKSMLKKIIKPCLVCAITI